MLVYVGGLVTGVVSTVIGSWISSKIGVYHESRKAHLEEIKQKVLMPIQDGLGGYSALVHHQSPVVTDSWVRRRKEKISVTEHPNEEGPGLSTVAPDIQSATNPALYTDAKKRHFPEQIAHTEKFLAEWHSHAEACRAWVEKLASEILAESQLPPHPVARHGSPYVMHYRLGVFIYRRLFGNLDSFLFKCEPSNWIKGQPSSGWSIEGFDGRPAGGTEQQMDAMLSLLDRLMEREKATADRLRENADVLKQNLSLLSSELNYAIAVRRLHKRCDLVPFF